MLRTLILLAVMTVVTACASERRVVHVVEPIEIKPIRVEPIHMKVDVTVREEPTADDVAPQR